MSFSKETNYDKIAATYIASADEKPFTGYYERPYIIKKLPQLSGKRILDIGCASGYYSHHCLNENAEVIALDASQEMINYSRLRCGNNIKLKTYVHDIAQPLDFIDNNEIDYIICSLVLHYIENWEETLNEFYRVLKPNGKCFISTHHPINDYTEFNKENYFRKRFIEDTWTGFKEPIKVKYFVRPLKEYIQPMLNCKMKLLEIDEPEPVEKLKEINEKVYNRLKIRPAFLFFILEKEKNGM